MHLQGFTPRERSGLMGHHHSMTVWIDTHCHLDAPEFDPDRDAVRAQARAQGVAGDGVRFTEALERAIAARVRPLTINIDGALAALLHDLGHLVQEMEAVAAGHAAHLHIGVIPFVSGQLLSAAIARTMPQGRGITATIHEGQGPALLRQLRDHTLDVVVGWATPSVDLGQIDFEVLYHQPPRLIASRRLAARLGRTRLEWNMLADLDWILGTPDSPIREQVADIFLRAGLAPPTPSVQSDSSKLIGEMIVASDRAVSILPADIADELVRIAGAAIVPYSFDWTLPPISLFTRADGLRRNVDALFAAALREVFSRNGRA